MAAHRMPDIASSIMDIWLADERLGSRLEHFSRIIAVILVPGDFVTEKLVAWSMGDETEQTSAGIFLRYTGANASTPRLLNRLLDLLRDPNRNIRNRAAQAFANIVIDDASKDIPTKLLARLRFKDPAARAGAAYALGKFGPEAADAQIVDQLLELLEDSDSDVRYYAVYALGSIQEGELKNQLIKKLLACVIDGDESVRELAAETLASASGIEERTIIRNHFLQLLSASEADIWNSAIDRMVKVGANQDDDDIPSDLVSEIRNSAVHGLGEMGADAATDEVLDELTMPGCCGLLSSRLPTIPALRNMVLCGVVEPIKERLYELLSTNEPYAYQMALSAFSEIEELAVDEIDAEIFFQALEARQGSNLENAARVIARFRSPRANEKAINLLLGILADEKQKNREGAVRALIAFTPDVDSERIIKGLLAAIPGADSYLKAEIAESLGECDGAVRNKDVHIQLITFLKFPEWHVRSRAAATIAKLGAKRANHEWIKPLLDLLDDGEEIVRRNAVEAIRNLSRLTVDVAALEAFLRLHRDKDGHVRESARELTNRLLKIGYRWFVSDHGELRLTTAAELSGEPS